MRRVFVTLTLLVLAACGGSSGNDERGVPAATEGGLTPAQLENGVGPIQSVSLDAAIDERLAEEGEDIFKMKCSACHKMDQRYVGPAMADVLERRTPAYIMNMMLNPAEMLQKHPDAKAMLAEYMTPMPDQQLSEHDARAVFEYLREEAGESDD